MRQNSLFVAWAEPPYFYLFNKFSDVDDAGGGGGGGSDDGDNDANDDGADGKHNSDNNKNANSQCSCSSDCWHLFSSLCAPGKLLELYVLYLPT